MAKCPNCGQETARTRDWVCQWCGYPLPSGPFKSINKTFRELKEERLPQQSAGEEVRAETASEGKTKLPVVTKSEAVSKIEPEAKEVIEPAPVPAPSSNEKAITQPASTTAARPPEPTAHPQPEVKPEPAPAAIEITVADLLSAYETEGEAADARFASQLLRVTGVIDKINVKEALDIYSITLNSLRKSLLLQGVRCVFDRQHMSELKQLSAGETVTVQGKYIGSMIDISLRECSLVR